MAKNETKIDTEVEFSWISDAYPKSQTKFKLGYYFFRDERYKQIDATTWKK